MSTPDEGARRVVATVVRRHRRRPVRCDRCGQPEATHHLTVTMHQQPRRGWPTCEPCAALIAAESVAEAFGAAAGVQPAPERPQAAADEQTWPHPADDALVDQAAAWWAAIDHDTLAEVAARQFEAVLGAAQWSPDRSRLVAVAQDIAADVTGLSRAMPDPGPDRTAWLLAWGHADAWAQAIVDRLAGTPAGAAR